MLRWFLRCSVVALPLAGCGSNEDDSARLAADDKDVLDACGLPSPCDPLLVLGGKVLDGSCLFEQLAARRPAHLTKSARADGGDCETRTEVYASGSDEAIVWTLTEGADCDSAYTIEACVLKPAPFFAACDADTEVSGAGSACYSDWFENCAPIDEPACP